MNDYQRLQLLVFQEAPGLWIVRGLEHDLTTEARSIGLAVRAMIRLVDSHTASDALHQRAPLSNFRPAPQAYWNAFRSGTPIALSSLGVQAPRPWDVALAIARHRPAAGCPATPLAASA